MNPVVTGVGFITPIGNDRPSVEQSLRDGRHGIEHVEFLGNADLPIKVAGTVKGFQVESPKWRDWSWPSGYDIPKDVLRGLAPHGIYAICAVEQALSHAGLSASDLAGDPDTGLYCASAGSAMLLHYNLAQMRAVQGARGNPLGVVSSIAGTLNFNLAAHFRITGALCGFVSACASSSHALGYAIDDLRLGRLNRAIVVGAEELNADSLLPFAHMRALSVQSEPRMASRPFDVGRDGFVGAGGAVALILEAPAAAAKRGARPLAEAAGWGQAADGYRVAASHPEGAGLRLAMERALADAKAAPGDIDYVSAHATSTPVGDSAEALAIVRVFGSRGLHPCVGATKGLTGHTLSLSGVMQAGFCVLSITGGFMPGNPHLGVAADECEGLELPRQTVARAPARILSNSSGFGGSNVCHVFAAPNGFTG
ncbi:MAG TPA: beta-ketoacyl-[acyl-carrier-protein] synthase family protein [Opitutaceae bacterium]|nr:beta-ketoacyl-[acyl-carrier-protein] synthase family protein [Opitutaceae bacterium]